MRFREVLAAPFLLSLVTATAAPARAGVTVETRMEVHMLGGSGQGTGRVEVQGRMRRETRSLALDAPGASEMGPAQQSDAITRLDRGVQWQLDPEDSTYRAVKLSDLATDAGGMTLPGLAPGAAPRLAWDVAVTPTEETDVIQGLTARRTDIVLTGRSASDDAGPLGSVRLVSQWWMATGVPGEAELRAFDDGFARATLGLSADVPGIVAGLPGASDAIARLTAARGKLHGVALRTVVSVEAPGIAQGLGAMLGGGDAGSAAAGPLVTTTIEVTSLHTARIPGSRFALPRGFHVARAPAPAAPESVHE